MKSFKAAWQALPEDSLASRAIAGGAVAGSLSEVFCAAYQSAVRQCFEGLDQNSWYCFAASEDRRGELPPVRLEDTRLSGSKTWIAASDLVDKLVVTTDGPIVLVDRSAEGLRIENGEPKTFLPELAQGRAHFDATPISSTIRMKGDFGLAEAFYVTCASAGYLSRWGSDAELEGDTGTLQTLETQMDASTLADIHERIKARGKVIAADEGDERLKQDFETSGRLLGMYGRGLRSRRAG